MMGSPVAGVLCLVDGSVGVYARTQLEISLSPWALMALIR